MRNFFLSLSFVILGTVIGLVISNWDKIYEGRNTDSDISAEINATSTTTLSDDKKNITYTNKIYDFKVIYPRNFELGMDDVFHCYALVKSESDNHIRSVNVKNGEKISIGLEQNILLEKGTIWEGSIGHRLADDCSQDIIISIAVMKKELDFDMQNFTKNKNAELEGMFEGSASGGSGRVSNETLNGKKVLVVSTLGGGNMGYVTKSYHFVGEDYIYRLDHSYASSQVLAPSENAEVQKSSYSINEAKKYNLGLLIIDSFYLLDKRVPN